MLKIPDWRADFYRHSTLFKDLVHIQPLHEFGNHWPDIEQLNRMLSESTRSLSGQPIRFVAETADIPYPQLSYEERIFYHGLVSTRENNWHDFFNALIWVLFPQTKAVLNALHIREIKVQTGKKRTAARDAITHFDESGIIVVSSQPKLFTALKQHRWQEVFYHQRQLWGQQIDAFIFGHGIYEKALNPFIGLTAKMYALPVSSTFFQSSGHTCSSDHQPLARIRQIDQLLSQHISHNQSLDDNRFLSPLPILGIPDWYQNDSMDFYQNSDYFRPLKRNVFAPR